VTSLLLFLVLTPSTHAAAAGPSRKASAAEQPVLGVEIPIKDPSGRALHNLHRALWRASAGAGKARLLFFGASHTSTDWFTGHIRRKLQQRFGDAGHGFVMPVKPWQYYRHLDVEVSSSGGWRSFQVGASSKTVGYFGMAGVTVESSSKEDFGRVVTPKKSPVGRKVSRYALLYLRGPPGGQLDVSIDGNPVYRLNTRADEVKPGFMFMDVDDGEHSFEVRPLGDGLIRLFGLVLERDEPGVVVDTLGIRGSRARYHLLWNDRLYRAQLAWRRPDLVVLAYGTNESGDKNVPIPRYEKDLRLVVARIRQVVPEASCLLIGPSDRPIKGKKGTWLPRQRTQDIIAVQREVSAEAGCGFFDLVAFQGGPMSMPSWVKAKPPMAAPDHVHFTRRGYERLAEVLLAALLKDSGLSLEAP